MDKYAQLASLFGSTASTGSSDLDRLFGLKPITDEERESWRQARRAEMEALLAEEQGVGPSQGSIPSLSGDVKKRAEQLAPIYQQVSEKYGVPFDLLMAQAHQESGFNPAAVSSAGAEGIAQFMPGTAGQYGLKNRRDPVASADAQARYMRDLLNQFGGDEDLAIAAYNAGPGNVLKARGIPQNKETPGYVSRVKQLRGLYGSGTIQAPAESFAGSPADQLLPAQPDVDLNKFELVTLTDGQQAYMRKGISPEEAIEKLKARGIEALPTRQITAPNGQPVLVRYNLTDDEALAKLKEKHPEYMVREAGKPPAETGGVLGAMKKGVLESVDPILTGLGGEAQRLGEYLGPESTVGGYATEAGKAMREYGAEAGKRAEEAFKMPEDASWFAKNFGYPLAEGAGQLATYGSAFALPGAGLGTAAGLTALYGGAMGEAERKMAETGQAFVPSEGRMVAGADVALNMVGLRMLGPLKKVFGPEAEQAPREFVQKLIAENGIEGAKAKMGSVVGDVLKGMGVTGGANIANEVAEDMLYRGYAGQDLFSPEALQSYKETAKQVAPIGVGMGVVHGGAKAHVKAEEIARAEEQQAQAQQTAEQQQAGELATFEDRMRSARTDVNRLAAYRDQVLSEFEGREDLTPEEQARVATLRSDDASKILDDFIAQRQERKAAEQAALPEDLRGLPTEEAKLLQRARAGLTPEEVPSASQIESPVAPDGRRIQEPQVSQAEGYPPVSREGVRVSDQVSEEPPAEIREVQVEGVERPTTDSTGAPIHTTEEGVKNFWKGFADTKVVDAEGRPQVVYHGTSADIDIFRGPAYFSEDTAEAGAYTGVSTLAKRERLLGKFKYKPTTGADKYANTRIPYRNISDIEDIGVPTATDNGVVTKNKGGTFSVFTDLVPDYKSHDPYEDTLVVKRGDSRKAFRDLATDFRTSIDEAYPAGVGEQGNVVPVYLDIKNPKELSALEANKFGARLGGTSEQWQAAVKKWKAEGYDGIVTVSDDPGYAFEGKYPPRQWIPFDPSQIKSAIGNKGEFDITEPEISEARGRVQYPDLGKLPLDVEKFKDVTNAKDLLDRYMEHGTDEGLLDLARQFAESSHTPGIKIKFVSGPQDAPPAIWNRFKSGAGALTATDRQGSTIYFQSKPGSFSEDFLGHEMLHGMTVGALKRSPHLQKELGTISGSIGKAFEHFAKQNGSDEQAQNLSNFWNRVVKSSPDELLAYGMTSPTFKATLSQYAADGRPLSATRTEAEMAKIRMRPTMPEAVTAKAPAPLTLWDKFVDFMRKLFRIPEKNKLAFEKALNDYTTKQAEYEQGVRDYQTIKPLARKLDESLKELLAVTEREGTGLPARGPRVVTREETGVPKEGEAIAPPTPEQGKLLLEQIKKSGLTASAKQGTLGESMGAMIQNAVNGDVLTAFQQSVFDERAPIAKALRSLGANVGKKLRADLAWAAYNSRGNTIQQGVKNGYTIIGTDGTLEAVENSQLAPEKIYERIRAHGKKLGMSPEQAEKVVAEMLVRLRAGTIREQDAQTRDLASNFFARADELEDFARGLKGAERKKFTSAAAKLRRMAEEKLESVGEGRTYITPEQVSEGHKLYQMYKGTLSREVDNLHTLLRTIPDMLYNAGMIDKQKADEFKKYPFYFPFYDKAKFDEDMIDPLKEERLQSYLKGMGRGLKSVSEVKRQEAHAHTIYAGDNLVRHLMYWSSAAAEHTARVNTCKQLEITGGATRLKGEPSDKNFVVKVKEDGRDVFYKIDDPNVYYAFQSAGPVTNSFVRMLQKVARVQRNFQVFTPLFWFKQIIREPKQASRLAKVGVITPMDAMRELAKIATGTSKGYKRISQKGVVGPVDLAGTPAERVIMLTQGKGLPTKVLEGLHHIHEAVDAATRAVVYDRALAKYKKWGFDEETADALAIKDSRELMNFARQGKSSTVRNLRAVTPFLGSYINSVDVILKSLSPDKYGKLSKADAMEVRRQFMGTSASLMMMGMAYSLAMSDDDEWVNRDDRNTSVLMRNPFANKDKHPFIAFPVEFELGWLQHTLPENLILTNLGAITPTSMEANLKQSAASLLLPPMGVASILRPLAVKALQVEDDKLNFGTSRGEAGSGRGLEQFHDKRASQLSKEIVKKLGEMGIQSFSPDDTEEYMRSVFGGAWAIGTSAADFAFANQTGEPVMPAKTVTEQIPFATGVFPKQYKDVAVRDAFNVLSDIQKVQETFSKAKNTKDLAVYNTVVSNEDYVKAVTADKKLSSLSQKMEEISTQMQINMNSESTAEEKRRINDELTERREQIAREILKKAKLLGVYE